MALWKARGGSLNKDLEFRSWHCGRQGGGSLNKELGFRSWHSGRQGGGSLNKELDFRLWHSAMISNPTLYLNFPPLMARERKFK